MAAYLRGPLIQSAMLVLLEVGQVVPLMEDRLCQQALGKHRAFSHQFWEEEEVLLLLLVEVEAVQQHR